MYLNFAKVSRKIGENSEFLNLTGILSGFLINSPYINKKLLYTLRRRYLSGEMPTDLARFLQKVIEDDGEYKFGRTEEESNSIAVFVTSILCAAFGPRYMDFRDIRFWIPGSEEQRIEWEVSTNKEAIQYIELYRSELESLVEEYENEASSTNIQLSENVGQNTSTQQE